MGPHSRRGPAAARLWRPEPVVSEPQCLPERCQRPRRVGVTHRNNTIQACVNPSPENLQPEAADSPIFDWSQATGASAAVFLCLCIPACGYATVGGAIAGIAPTKIVTNSGRRGIGDSHVLIPASLSDRANSNANGSPCGEFSAYSTVNPSGFVPIHICQLCWVYAGGMLPSYTAGAPALIRAPNSTARKMAANANTSLVSQVGITFARTSGYLERPSHSDSANSELIIRCAISGYSLAFRSAASFCSSAARSFASPACLTASASLSSVSVCNCSRRDTARAAKYSSPATPPAINASDMTRETISQIERWSRNTSVKISSRASPTKTAIPLFWARSSNRLAPARMSLSLLSIPGYHDHPAAAPPRAATSRRASARRS
jgi:hypothetical protein